MGGNLPCFRVCGIAAHSIIAVFGAQVNLMAFDNWDCSGYSCLAIHWFIST
jgi:hypothetical protein